MNLSASVLEYKFFKNTLKQSYLSKNVVKNELFCQWFLRILRLFMEVSTCHDVTVILSRYLYLHWLKMNFLLFLHLSSKAYKQKNYSSLKKYICYSILIIYIHFLFSLHKNWSFPFRISSVNVTKLQIGSHLLKKFSSENFIFSFFVFSFIGKLHLFISSCFSWACIWSFHLMSMITAL